MRVRCMIAVVALALSGFDAGAAIPRRNGWSRGSFPARAQLRGAVYELRLRVPETALEQYVAKYARWFLPVDQQEGSGRKLLSLLAREHGDEYNIVFLYWYADAYKHNYYCQYRKAFFQHHAQDPAFLPYYQAAVRLAGGGTATKDMLLATADALKADCTDPQTQADLAEDTIMQIDRELAAMIEQDEGTWNFGINPCQVAKLYDAGREAKDRLQGCHDAEHPSMLERAIDLEWPKPEYPRR